MQKIDRRRHYILILDTETANTIQNGNSLDMSNVLVYDCGFAVVDTHGTVYETHSYINSDIFQDEKDLMRSAYYAAKIPLYERDLQNGTRKLATTAQIRKAMLDTIDKWGIKEVAAHNARFDYNALNTTRRFVTRSKARYWFPFDKVEVWDTMKGVSQVICKMSTYRKFCIENGYLTKNNQLRKTAEIVYRFISKNNDFQESHTGLEDVLIEAQILAYCYRQHKKMDLRLYPNKKQIPKATKLQKQILTIVKINK